MKKNKKVLVVPFFENAKNDNEKLLNLQHEFKEGSQKALTQMYKVGYEVATKYINSIAKKNVFVSALSEQERKEKAHNAITYIVERYITKKSFLITKSFTAYIYLRVIHELFYKRKVDDIVQFVSMEDLTSKEL